ncbi:MAG: acyltransferase family protein [Anaerovoracaceae bacterium]|jgi:uncharacterized membrane protein
MHRIYLDNVRWAAVLLVLIYHVCYLFNGVGVPGAVPGAANIPAFDALEYVVYPWIMVLLFVVAGMSARYSLERRTAKQFLRERAAKRCWNTGTAFSRLMTRSSCGIYILHYPVLIVTCYLLTTVLDLPAPRQLYSGAGRRFCGDVRAV